MSTLTKKCILFLILSAHLNNGWTQEVFATSGDYYQNDHGHNMHWTIGEVVIDTYKGDQSLTQGFHQIEFIISNVIDAEEDYIDMKIYPNPARNHVFLEAHTDQVLHLGIYDVRGALIREKEHPAKGISRIDLSGMTDGIYFLRIMHANQLVKTFKLSKN